VKQKVGWADAIQQAFRQEADVVPPGWQRLEEIAQELKQNKYHVCRRLNKLIALGRVEVRKFRTMVKGSAGKHGPRLSYLRPNAYYRLTKKS
jgi:predicted ArsR family transcriptional regulator